MPNTAPIGVFDSGVGGLTVARAILDQMPQESITYLGDTANSPYGNLPIAQIRQHSLQVMDQLVNSGVKLLVIACNSASAAVLRDARERYTNKLGIPIVEVIHPAVKRAVTATHTNKIGVIGTVATIMSKAYDDAFVAVPQIKLFSQSCPRFVDFVEKGITVGEELLEVAEQYLFTIQKAQVDTLILACTHYPLLAGVISHTMGSAVTLVSSAEETAKDIYQTLLENKLTNFTNSIPNHKFVATGNVDTFHKLAKRFLGPEVLSVQAAKNL